MQAVEKKLQDAKVEHADARPIGAQLDSAIAIAANKNAELEKQREQVRRAQEKLNRLQAGAMEADKKVTTLRAEALTAARTQEGQKLSPRDYFEKIAKGVAAVKESLKEGEKEVLSPIELELSEVIKQFEDGKEDVQMGNVVQNTQTEYWEDAEKRWTNAENTQQKEAVFQEILANKKRRNS